MFELFARRAACPSAPPDAGVVLRSTLCVHGQQMEQLQLLTEHYTATRLGPLTTLFLAEQGERFVIHFGRRQLQRLDVERQAAEMQRLRPLLGELHLAPCGEPEEVDGWACRRRAFHNEQAHIVVRGEVWCARLPALEATALGRERAFDARLQLVHLPLAADEVVVRSQTRVLAPQLEEDQTLRLLSAGPDPALTEEIRRALEFRVVG